MAFFDKLGETITSKSKDVAKKAKDMTELASLNVKINTQQDDINKAYTNIGKKYYEKYKDDSSNEFEDEFEIITNAFSKISRLKEEMQLIKNNKICSKCGAEVNLESAFCPKCGFKFEVETYYEDSENSNVDDGFVDNAETDTAGMDDSNTDI